MRSVSSAQENRSYLFWSCFCVHCWIEQCSQVEGRSFSMDMSNMTSQATNQSKSLPQMMRQHPLFFYFLMAYAFSWIWIVVFILLLHLPLIFAAASPFVGPTLSAYIMTALTEGKAGM